MTTLPPLPSESHRDRWSFTPPLPGRMPKDRLRGSAAILRYLRSYYPGGQLGPGVLVTLLLDRHSMLLGQGRVPDQPPDLDLPAAERSYLLTEVLHTMCTSHPRGAAGFACLLATMRAGPDSLRTSDIGWWTSLRMACRATGLHAADVLVATPSGWFTVRAGTSGPGEWPGEPAGRPP